jgi:predicted O-linked N-acetylglucosamine transferase (SPINDLY family)
MFNCWLDILQAVPNSVLWLSCTTNESIICLKNYAQAHQINPERLIFKTKTVLNDDWHHRLADLYLDTSPIAAGTTSILSAWVGLPVLTLAADTPQSRYGAEIMKAAGITSTTASSKDEYYKIAVDLATNLNKLSTIKQSLLNNRLQAPLFNQKRYIMQLEKAYQLMYEDYKTGAKQKLIKVPM